MIKEKENLKKKGKVQILNYLLNASWTSISPSQLGPFSLS